MSVVQTHIPAQEFPPTPVGVARAATVMLNGVGDQPMWALGEDDLVELLAVVGVARHVLARVEVYAAAEALGRGLHTDIGARAPDWLTATLAQEAPPPSTGHAVKVTRVAQARTDPDLAVVCHGVDTGVLSVARAGQLIAFHTDLAPVGDPEDLAGDLATLTAAASDTLIDDPAGGPPARVRGLSDRELAVAIRRTARLLKPAEDLEDEEDRARAGRVLYKRPGPAGLAEYRWVLDPEGAAIVDAAVSAYCAPTPGPEGAPDLRSPARRRADALLTLVQHGLTAADNGPRTDKAQLLITINWEDLLADLHHPNTAQPATTAPAQTPTTTPPGTTPGDTTAPTPGASGPGPAAPGASGPGPAAPGRAFTRPGPYHPDPHGAGTTATGEVLSPATIRRIACDAAIIPLILGADSEILDLGRLARLFTPGQRRAISHRDKGCTYPGYTTPPQWCECHHVIHWIHGGPTDLTNAALLCPRHHHHVHNHDLTATITPTGVTWHT